MATLLFPPEISSNRNISKQWLIISISLPHDYSLLPFTSCPLQHDVMRSRDVTAGYGFRLKIATMQRVATAAHVHHSKH